MKIHSFHQNGNGNNKSPPRLFIKQCVNCIIKKTCLQTTGWIHASGPSHLIKLCKTAKFWGWKNGVLHTWRILIWQPAKCKQSTVPTYFITIRSYSNTPALCCHVRTIFSITPYCNTLWSAITAFSHVYTGVDVMGIWTLTCKTRCPFWHNRVPLGSQPPILGPTASRLNTKPPSHRTTSPYDTLWRFQPARWQQER